jgi:hypothetical protein
MLIYAIVYCTFAGLCHVVQPQHPRWTDPQATCEEYAGNYNHGIDHRFDYIDGGGEFRCMLIPQGLATSIKGSFPYFRADQ